MATKNNLKYIGSDNNGLGIQYDYYLLPDGKTYWKTPKGTGKEGKSIDEEKIMQHGESTTPPTNISTIGKTFTYNPESRSSVNIAQNELENRQQYPEGGVISTNPETLSISNINTKNKSNVTNKTSEDIQKENEVLKQFGLDKIPGLPEEYKRLYVQLAEGENRPFNPKTRSIISTGPDRASKINSDNFANTVQAGLAGFMSGALPELNRTVTSAVQQHRFDTTIKPALEKIYGTKFTGRNPQEVQALNQDAQDLFNMVKSGKISASQYKDAVNGLQSKYDTMAQDTYSPGLDINQLKALQSANIKSQQNYANKFAFEDNPKLIVQMQNDLKKIGYKGDLSENAIRLKADLFKKQGSSGDAFLDIMLKAQQNPTPQQQPTTIPTQTISGNQ